MIPSDTTTRLFLVAADGVAGADDLRKGALAPFEELAPGLADLAILAAFSARDALSRPDASPSIRIVTSGQLALTDEETGLCISLAEAGSPIASGAVTGIWICSGTLLEISFAQLIDHYGPSPALALLHRATALSQAAVQRELVCAVRHPSVRRLSRWLSHSLREATTVSVTQADLAQLTGLQRTSICQAMATIQDRGAVKVSRGRIFLRDASVLSDLACDCGDAQSAGFDAAQRLAG